MNTPEKVVAILEAMALADGMSGISDLSRQLGVGKNNIFRILSALVDKGWVTQDDESKKYGLTGAMAGVAFRALSQLDIQKISAPHLEDLAHITGETSALTVRVELERMFLNYVPSVHEIRQVVPLGRRLKLWKGSGGKAMLAFMSEEDIQTVLNQFVEETKDEDTQNASGQLVTVESIREELALIKQRGFAVGSGERTSGIVGISAPIFNHKNEVAGAISVSGPLPRFDTEKALNCSEFLMGKAKMISSALGSLRV